MKVCIYTVNNGCERDSFRNSFLRVSVSKVSGLETLNIAKKWFIKIFTIQLFFICCIFRQETTKIRRKNARNLKKFYSEVITTFFKNISAKCTNFEVSSLGLEFQVSSLGVFDEVSVLSQNFNKFSVSQVTVSTTSLLCGSSWKHPLSSTALLVIFFAWPF